MKTTIAPLLCTSLLLMATMALTGPSPRLRSRRQISTSDLPVQRAGLTELAKQRLTDAFRKLPLTFEANQGQTDSEVKFLARSDGYSLFLTSTDAVLALRTGRASGLSGRNEEVLGLKARKTDAAESNAVLRMKLAGANPKPLVAGLEELPAKKNYFVGNDPA